MTTPPEFQNQFLNAMPCPICKRPVPESERTRAGSAYPFCTERCKLIDLGRWLDGAYQIPVARDDDENATPPDAPGDD